MIQDAFYSKLFGGALPSNTSSIAEVVSSFEPSPFQMFTKAIHDIEGLTPEDRLIIAHTAAVATQTDNPKLVCKEPLEWFTGHVQEDAMLHGDLLTKVVKAYIKAYEIPNRAEPEMGAFDGDPSSVVRAVIAHVMDAFEDDAIRDEWLAIEAAIRAVNGMGRVMRFYNSLDHQFVREVQNVQIVWALKGLKAGISIDPVVPEFVYQQDIFTRQAVSDFLVAAPGAAQRLYTQRLSKVHLKHIKHAANAAFFRFREIGLYVSDRFGADVGGA